MNFEQYLPSDYKLLYVTEYGSTLYGTDSESSDTDYRGIYLPSIQDIILNKAKHTISISTGNQHSSNSASDVDVSLFSV